jgi:hypothetical protein
VSLVDGMTVHVTVVASDRAGQRAVVAASIVVRHAPPTVALPQRRRCAVVVAAASSSPADACAGVASSSSSSLTPSVGTARSLASIAALGSDARVFGCWSNAGGAGFTDVSELTTSMRLLKLDASGTSWTPVSAWLDAAATAVGASHMFASTAAAALTNGVFAVEVAATNDVALTTTAQCPTALFVGALSLLWYCHCHLGCVMGVAY